ncbi:hypothetical protein NDU88_004901 [Pleurodeles waltl]|uniref:Uncharacterized protein n=1 Tax=Pleurodeles waltl TaxID=8319 RepID=A0AAV7PFD1_PLEWA|nr:hypothetical protein NDU88_004901 [Pleurodeles waltl]
MPRAPQGGKLELWRRWKCLVCPAPRMACSDDAEVRRLGACEQTQLGKRRNVDMEVLTATTWLVREESVSKSAVKEVGVPCCGYSGTEVAAGLGCWLAAGPGGFLAAMGKHDAKQPKLNFDHKRSTRQGELEQGPQAAERRDLAADDQGEDLRTLMLEMRSSLRNIDTKLDNLTSQLDSVKTQVATHETRSKLLGFERRGSPADLPATPFHTGK